MGLGALREKQLAKLCGRFVRLESRLPDGRWLLTDLATSQVDMRSEPELWGALERGVMQFSAAIDQSPLTPTDELLQQFSDAVRGPKTTLQEDEIGSNAVKRREYVTCTRGLTGAAHEEAIRSKWMELGWPKKAPAYSTVRSWVAKSEGATDPVAALRERNDKKGRHRHRYKEPVLKELRDARDNYYLRKSPRISVKSTLEKARDSIRLKNATRCKTDQLPLPGRKALIAIINEIDQIEIIARRYGADVAMREMRVSLGGVKVTKPLQRVEIDHTKLAIFLLDDDFSPLGRANLTVAIDACARAPLGYWCGMEPPSVVSLARCLRFSVQPKVEFLKRYPDVNGSWPCFGVAETWVVDNGFEEHADAIKQAASEMGVQSIDFCRRATPWQKPHIERHFRQIDQGLLQELPGATMENILKRTDFDPKVDLLIRKSTFDRLFVKWIVDVFLTEPQAALRNRSPREAWQDAEGTFAQFVPTEQVLLERLFLRQVESRVLDHEGIEYDGVVYNSLDMRRLREKFGKKVRVTIRVSDEDLGYIQVGVPGHDIWVRVPCLDQVYSAGLTRWQHGKCRAMLKACRDDGIEVTLAEARQEIQSGIEAEQGAVAAGRKLARARMLEQDPHKRSAQNGHQERECETPKEGSSETDSPLAMGASDDVPDFEVGRRSNP